MNIKENEREIKGKWRKLKGKLKQMKRKMKVGGCCEIIFPGQKINWKRKFLTTPPNDFLLKRSTVTSHTDSAASSSCSEGLSSDSDVESIVDDMQAQVPLHSGSNHPT